MNATQDAKKIFRQCGTCSQTFGHILNREFGHPKEIEELALDPLAGGILNQGHQCGMLWGTALAIGAESYRRNKNLDQAIAVSVTATQNIIESFTNRTETVNCREITGINMSNVFGLIKFMLKTMVKGINNSPCFNLAEDWAPEAIQSASEGLEERINLSQSPISCASEVVRKIGGNEEEISMVSGFAGGLGLSGKGCGVLSAAIWMRTLEWCKENPGKTPPFFNNKPAKKLLNAFKEITNSEFSCEKICGKKFDNINEHTNYIKNGGCEKIINVLADS